MYACSSRAGEVRITTGQAELNTGLFVLTPAAYTLAAKWKEVPSSISANKPCQVDCRNCQQAKVRFASIEKRHPKSGYGMRILTKSHPA